MAAAGVLAIAAGKRPARPFRHAVLARFSRRRLKIVGSWRARPPPGRRRAEETGAGKQCSPWWAQGPDSFRSRPGAGPVATWIFTHRGANQRIDRAAPPRPRPSCWMRRIPSLAPRGRRARQPGCRGSLQVGARKRPDQGPGRLGDVCRRKQIDCDPAFLFFRRSSPMPRSSACSAWPLGGRLKSRMRLGHETGCAAAHLGELPSVPDGNGRPRTESNHETRIPMQSPVRGTCLFAPGAGPGPSAVRVRAASWGPRPILPFLFVCVPGPMFRPRRGYWAGRGAVGLARRRIWSPTL